MAHYECPVCGDVLCNDADCLEIRRQQQQEFSNAIGMKAPFATLPKPKERETMQTSTPEQIRADQDARSQIKFMQLHSDATLPTRGSPLAAGYDLFASEDVTFLEDEVKAIPLGFATALPTDIHGRVESRSGRALDSWIVVTGVIDADYRGEWKVLMANYSGETRTIKAGDKIAQVVFRQTIIRDFKIVDALDDTARGAGGFGSTGQR